MISDKIRELREQAGYSQAQLAKRLNVTRSSVNAWEMGISMPTTQYVIAMSKLVHVSADYILGIQNAKSISLDGYTEREITIIRDLLKYFDEHK